MTASARVLVSESDFLALPETTRPAELVDGEVVMPPSPSFWHQELLGRMVAALRAERTRPTADLVVAHNVEAAWACAAAGVRPFVYFAHTSMREELPYYVPPGVRALARAARDGLDRGAYLGAATVFALTPGWMP